MESKGFFSKYMSSMSEEAAALSDEEFNFRVPSFRARIEKEIKAFNNIRKKWSYIECGTRIFNTPFGFFTAADESGKITFTMKHGNEKISDIVCDDVWDKYDGHFEKAVYNYIHDKDFLFINKTI